MATKEKSHEQRKNEYLKNPICCPVCKSENISSGHIECDGSEATANVKCLACGERWIDVYTLTDIRPEA